MTLSEDAAPEPPEVRLEATASGSAQIYQALQDLHVAQRDLHVHYQDGVRSARRALTGKLTGECPFPGLAAFGIEHAQWFHGRDALTADVLVRLDASMWQGGALMVVAPSGAGKSSLLRAGVVAAISLGRLAVAGSDRWPCVVFTPTDRPLAALAAGLSQASGYPHQWTAILEQGPAACVGWMRAVLRDRDASSEGDEGGRGRRWVVVVDQLEELFAQCGSEPERQAFLAFLQAMSWQGDDGQEPAALVLYGIRSDFLDACMTYPHLLATQQNSPVFVGPMSDAEVRESILYPAADVGLEVEPGLVELLLNDLGEAAETAPSERLADDMRAGRYETGRLPLLAHALRATWQLRAGHILTTQGYSATGGIPRAVATTADREYGRLSPDDRRTARTLLLALVKVGDSTADTRRRIGHTSLLDRSSNPESAARVVEAFTRARLLTREHDSVEITHEVLLRAWPRLREWINTDRVGNLLRQDIEEAAVNWKKADRDVSMLYRGSRLENALEWRKSAHTEEPSAVIGEFLDAGTKNDRRSTVVRRTVIGILAALALIASTAAVVAFQKDNTARRETRSATVNRLQGEADVLRNAQQSVAAQLDLAAYEMQPTPALGTSLINDANNPLSETLTRGNGAVGSLAFSRDGHTLATVSDGLRLCDLTDRANGVQFDRLPHIDTGLAKAVAFSPDGHILAIGEDDGSVRLWDMSHPSKVTQFGPFPTGDTLSVVAVAFSPVRHILATGSSDDSVRLWDVTDPAHIIQLGNPLTGATGYGVSLAFSSDGRTLAAVSMGLRLWDVTHPSNAKDLGGLPGDDSSTVNAVAFGTKGHTLATGDLDGSVRLWDVTDLAHITPLGNPLTGATGAVNAVAFSPDGLTLATGSDDSSVRLWDVTEPNDATQLGRPLTGHTSAVNAVAFSPDGLTLATGSDDSTVQMWDRQVPLGRPLADEASIVNLVAFGPGGKTLATGSDGSPILWDVAHPAHVVRLRSLSTGGADFVNALAFSPDGRSVASGSYDGVELWDATHPAHATGPGRLSTGGADFVNALAFSPDGRTLAGGTDDGIELWDVTRPAHVVLLRNLSTGGADFVKSLAFSPDRRTLAGGTDDGIELWDVTRPEHPVRLGRPFADDAGAVNALAFSPDGRTLAGTSDLGTVRLWDVSHPAEVSQLGRPLTGHTGAVTSVVFSPDGKTLATGSNDSTVRLWDMSHPAEVSQLGRPLTGHTSAVTSVAFSPDGKTLATASNDRTVELLNMSIHEAIEHICADTDSLTRQQWKQYLPERDYDPPCQTGHQGS